LQRGVSLLEILVTTVIVTTGLLVVMSSFVAMAKSNRYAGKMEIANNLLRLELENVRNQSYSEIQSLSLDGIYTDLPEFERRITVTEQSNVKQVLVQIYFENGRRVAQATTMVAQL
jgi:Tfp pilus assembly protein PilV